ncbi:T9SS type A sorting domain-containing protein [Mucilaginibacter myungsuensis]|uniref:T9SS type A sorting domain-containing protein n=1 Tax=Mucilaginibacter myungsuensis TaxID=649104 RepID=A0A929KXM6_9SPHI|nr:T9SS type A sorting domain-containing protein [Mucilaginibacter myungsuensis]MBE9663536.1 T9SS type A sorting domain-containing protein [Mucilaginibacter myungsuensis]MDN3600274.1 T9SS type A sorting domain-containing protein [Mucilaginibacter myungsuensis]
MKTIIRTAATVFALALLSTGVFAADTTTKRDTATNEVTAYVSYDNGVVGVDVNIDNATEGASTVTIYDAAGNVLLTDSFKNDSAAIRKNYLVDEVAAGDYVIKVVTNAVAVQKEVSLRSDDSKLLAIAF